MTKKNQDQENIKTLKEYDAYGLEVPSDMIGWLRSDHAGETGAVWIYRGAICAFWSREIRKMAENHIKTEIDHLTVMSHLLPVYNQSKLIFLWKVMGFSLGFLSALFGFSTFCITINAVETFVEDHYKIQVAKLRDTGSNRELLGVLERCCEDEIHHKLDAKQNIRSGKYGLITLTWVKIVKTGSGLAVKVSSKI
jgi:ubiquinone biosynthesis monooxygenase Coq7